MSNWKEIWNGKKISDDIIDLNKMSTEQVFFELKKLMGITVYSGEGVVCDDFINQFKTNISEMTFSTDNSWRATSFFDLGCGTGAYLWLLSKIYSESDERIILGGIDYSDAYIKTAKKIINSNELYSGESIDIDTTRKYDVVYSRSVFQYFDDEVYAKKVAEKMIIKSTHSAAFLDIHDLSLKEDFLNYRRSVIDDYDKKYENTKHLFLPKEFFISLSEEYNCDIKFAKSRLKGYWNDRFTYDVYMFHK